MKDEAHENEKINVAEAGQIGGRTTLERHGLQFFRDIGRKGGRRTTELYSDQLKEFGKRGGRPRPFSLPRR